MAKKRTTDLVDVASEYSFPASDPPSYMGGTAVAGAPPEDGAPHEPVGETLTDPEEATPASPDSGSEERIRQRAYEIWESEGRSGDSREHWLRAEREIRDEPLPREAEAPDAGAASAPPSEDAGKMVDQVQVALKARPARSKQVQRAGATGKPRIPKGSAKDGARKSEPNQPD